jgi:hypothetical protein
VVDDLAGLFVERGVELRKPLQGGDHGLDDERQKSELRSIEVAIVGELAGRIEFCDVAFLDMGDGRNRAVGMRHVLGDHSSHAAEWDAATADCGRGRRRHGWPTTRTGTGSPGNGLNVCPYDPAVRAAARYLPNVHAQLAGQLSDGWHGLYLPVVVPSGRWLAWRRRRRLRSVLGRLRAARCRPYLLGCRRAVFVDADQYGSDRHDVPFTDMDLADDAGERGWDLGHGLVRDHLDQEVVLFDRLSFGDEPAVDLCFRYALAEIRQPEFSH